MPAHHHEPLNQYHVPPNSPNTIRTGCAHLQQLDSEKVLSPQNPKTTIFTPSPIWRFPHARSFEVQPSNQAPQSPLELWPPLIVPDLQHSPSSQQTCPWTFGGSSHSSLTSFSRTFKSIPSRSKVGSFTKSIMLFHILFLVLQTSPQDPARSFETSWGQQHELGSWLGR